LLAKVLIALVLVCKVSGIILLVLVAGTLRGCGRSRQFSPCFYYMVLGKTTMPSIFGYFWGGRDLNCAG
jgi:hypothetical protein